MNSLVIVQGSPSLSAMVNSAWKQQTPPSNCGGPRPCKSGATKEDRPPPPPREQQASTKGNMTYDPGERWDSQKNSFLTISLKEINGPNRKP